MYFAQILNLSFKVSPFSYRQKHNINCFVQRIYHLYLMMILQCQDKIKNELSNIMRLNNSNTWVGCRPHSLLCSHLGKTLCFFITHFYLQSIVMTPTSVQQYDQMYPHMQRLSFQFAGLLPLGLYSRDKLQRWSIHICIQTLISCAYSIPDKLLQPQVVHCLPNGPFIFNRLMVAHSISQPSFNIE